MATTKYTFTQYLQWYAEELGQSPVVQFFGTMIAAVAVEKTGLECGGLGE